MGEVLILAFKIVDDIFLTGTDDYIRKFISKFNDRFVLYEVVHGPDELLNYL